MGRDLENAVARRIDNGKTRAYVLFAELLDDLGARGRFVAKRLPADTPFKFLDQSGRKTVGIDRESLVEPEASHFPVAGGGVLARRNGCAFAKIPDRVPRRRKVFQRFDVRKSQADEIGETERTRASDVAERVASHVAVVTGVREFPDSYAIQNDPDYPFKMCLVLHHGNFPLARLAANPRSDPPYQPDLGF